MIETDDGAAILFHLTGYGWPDESRIAATDTVLRMTPPPCPRMIGTACRAARKIAFALTARFFGEIYHAGGATADVRNEIFFKAAPTGKPGESMAWLYDGIAP